MFQTTNQISMGMGISWDDRIGEGFFERGNHGQFFAVVLVKLMGI